MPLIHNARSAHDANDMINDRNTNILRAIPLDWERKGTGFWYRIIDWKKMINIMIKSI